MKCLQQLSLLLSVLLLLLQTWTLLLRSRKRRRPKKILSSRWTLSLNRLMVMDLRWRASNLAWSRWKRLEQKQVLLLQVQQAWRWIRWWTTPLLVTVPTISTAIVLTRCWASLCQCPVNQVCQPQRSMTISQLLPTTMMTTRAAR